MLQEDVAQPVVGAAEHAVVPRACVHAPTMQHAAHAAQRVATLNSRAGCAHPADGRHGTGPSEAMRLAVHMSHRPTNAIACHGEDRQLHDARARRRRTGVQRCISRARAQTQAHMRTRLCTHATAATAQPACLPACLPGICGFAFRPALTERAVLYGDRTTLKSTELRRQ
jgi:hypothetical protein